MLRIVKESICIVIFSILLGFAINIVHPSGFMLTPKGADSQKIFSYLTLDKAYNKYIHGTVFIDARSSEEFMDSHIQGAVNLPAFSEIDFDQGLKSHFSDKKTIDELVIYCWNSECTAAEVAAERLVALNYSQRVSVIKDGFEGWINRGYPLDK